MLLVPVGAKTSSIDRTMFRRVLAGANDGVRACRVAHGLPDGRYVVRLTVEMDGKVTELELRQSPRRLSTNATACLRRTFMALKFPDRPPAPRPAPPPHRRGEPRHHLPPDLRAGPVDDGLIVIWWPFDLVTADGAT